MFGKKTAVNKKIHYALALALIVLVIVALLVSYRSSPSASERWYSPAQVRMGAAVYVEHCQSCHGVAAAGGAGDWQKPGVPPPLDGSAHTWHHPLPQLIRTVQNGGQGFGGQMPGFANILNKEEILSVLAYIQSYWPQPIYAQWEKRK